MLYTVVENTAILKLKRNFITMNSLKGELLESRLTRRGESHFVVDRELHKNKNCLCACVNMCMPQYARKHSNTKNNVHMYM